MPFWLYRFVNIPIFSTDFNNSICKKTWFKMVQIRYYVKAHKVTWIHGPKPQFGPKITNSRTISDRAVRRPSGTSIPGIFVNNGNLSVGDNQTALGSLQINAIFGRRFLSQKLIRIRITRHGMRLLFRLSSCDSFKSYDRWGSVGYISLQPSEIFIFSREKLSKGPKGIPYLRASQGSLKIKPIVLNLKS